MRYRFCCILVLVLAFGKVARAQRMYSAMPGLQPALSTLAINPAAIGGFSGDYCISIMSFNTLFDNSLGTLKPAGQLMAQLVNSDNSPERLFNFSGNTKFSMLLPMVDFKGPGVIFPVDEQNALAITTSIRAFNQFYNFDKLLYFATYNVPGVQSFSVNTRNFKWTMHGWSQLGLSYGGIIMDKPNSQLKMGLSINLLGGIAYAGLAGNTLNVNYDAAADSFALNNADVAFSSSIYRGNNTVKPVDLMGNITGKSGGGISFDAGLIWMTKAGKPLEDDNTFNYKVAVSLSIADLGKVTYKNMTTTTVTGNGYFNGQVTSQKVKSYNLLLQYINDRGYKTVAKTQTLPVYLPMTSLLCIDYLFTHGFYTSLNLGINLANDANFGNKYFTQLTLTPRYQVRDGNIGLPLTYNTLTRNLRVGLGGRYKGFLLGSDDVLLLVTGGQYGFNMYAGIAIVVDSKHKSGRY